jgi:two-component system heavy metal sensor histidine kinase CusS
VTLNGRKSITFRLTLFFASVSTTVLLLLGLKIGSLVERHFEELDLELLSGKLELVSHVLERIHSDRELESLPLQLESALVGHHGLALVILTRGGQTLYSTAGAKFPEELLAGVKGKSSRPTLWANPENRRYRGIFTEAPTGIEGATPLVVAVSTDLSNHEHFMYSFRTALWTVMGLAALLTGFLGWVAVRRGLAPLRDISRSAAGITANRLDQRLSAASIPAELAEVAKTLNEMLARLEESFHRLSDFSSDLAHELRTPVSNLLTQTQVTLSKPRTLDEYEDVLASNTEEFERLSRMIADMLFLAKSDNSLIIPHRERINLATEVNSLFEFYDALAEEKGVSLSCSGTGSVSGDRLMLRRAINNLLSNAVRHTSEGGQIAVRVDDSGGSSVVLTVENTGETIAPEHLPRLFDRFYRVDSSRRHFGEGAGLGLAMTRSIAHAHGGEVLARSEEGVTTFELRLPI